MTRDECIAELRLRQAECQHTDDIHPCEMAQARSGFRWRLYRNVADHLEGGMPASVLVSALVRESRNSILGAYVVAIQLVKQIAEECR